MRIQDLPIVDRPRERAQREGVKSLSTQELLQIVLGFGGKGSSIIEISQLLLSSFDGLLGLSKASLNELKQIKGISDAKALLLLSIFEIAKRVDEIPLNKCKLNSPEDVYYLLEEKLKNEPQENFILVLLDIKNNLINYKFLFKGGLNYNLVHMRDIYREVCKSNAYKFICVHNHPSGDPSPSENDIKVTKEIVSSSKVMGISFVDHIIIGNGCFFSFKSADLI